MNDIEPLEKEQLGHLAEEIRSIWAVAYESASLGLIAAKYRVGEAIATHSLYRKHAKTQGEFYMEVQRTSGVKLWILQDCVKFYETYPERNPGDIADELYTKHGSWRNIKATLYGGGLSLAERNTERPECNHKCPRHCK